MIVIEMYVGFRYRARVNRKVDLARSNSPRVETESHHGTLELCGQYKQMQTTTSNASPDIAP